MKAGDVVRLKSGGPPMTVESESPGSSGTVRCSWFFDTAESGSPIWDGPHDEVFAMDALEEVEPKP